MISRQYQKCQLQFGYKLPSEIISKRVEISNTVTISLFLVMRYAILRALDRFFPVL